LTTICQDSCRTMKRFWLKPFNAVSEWSIRHFRGRCHTCMRKEPSAIQEQGLLTYPFTYIPLERLRCQIGNSGRRDPSERRLRHLDSCQCKTILIGRVPRVDCPEHGVWHVTVPWALPHSRFAIMFERFAIEMLQMTQTVKVVMTTLRLHWDATWNIIQRTVARGKAPRTITASEDRHRRGDRYGHESCLCPSRQGDTNLLNARSCTTSFLS
jgi:hypothetical protein